MLPSAAGFYVKVKFHESAVADEKSTKNCAILINNVFLNLE